MPEDKEKKVEYLSMKLMDPWIEEPKNLAAPLLKYVHGPFRSYWYETFVPDIPAQLAWFFAHTQEMRNTEKWKEHPPELLIQDLLEVGPNRPDLDEITEWMDYYDYDNFKSGRYGN